MQHTDLLTWREANHLTQQEAAELLGTTKTSYYRWESGWKEHSPPPTILRLVHLLQKKKNVRRLRRFLNIPLA